MFQDRQALWETPKNVSWSVLPLVAGLFVVVEAVNRVGALAAGKRGLAELGKLPPWQGDLAGAFGVTAISNVINNLPSGLITGTAVVETHVAESLRNALLIGVDLGPNLSVTGSLATILWLIALRREGQEVSAWSFLKIGPRGNACGAGARGAGLDLVARKSLIAPERPSNRFPYPTRRKQCSNPNVRIHEPRHLSFHHHRRRASGDGQRHERPTIQVARQPVAGVPWFPSV